MGAAGVQLVKLTPYRSYVSTSFTLQSICILSIVGLKGGILSYSAVRTLSLETPFISTLQGIIYYLLRLLPPEPVEQQSISSASERSGLPLWPDLSIAH